jgi:hypothetical protein
LVRPELREEVLGVAADDKDGRPTDYSNRGDCKRPEIEEEVVGIVGICCSPDLPLDPPNNWATKKGWMTWAGISFSTRIISGRWMCCAPCPAEHGAAAAPSGITPAHRYREGTQ